MFRYRLYRSSNMFVISRRTSAIYYDTREFGYSITYHRFILPPWWQQTICTMVTQNGTLIFETNSEDEIKTYIDEYLFNLLMVERL